MHPLGVQRLTGPHPRAEPRLLQFQSTHPCRVRLPKRRSCVMEHAISIHAPIWGATTCRVVNDTVFRISIHAPTWGATARFLIVRCITRFQSTHPCRVRQVFTRTNPVYPLLFQSTHPYIYEYDSTFLHCCGLIGSHIVPIAHSVLSGLDNGPLFERERSRV